MTEAACDAQKQLDMITRHVCLSTKFRYCSIDDSKKLGLVFLDSTQVAPVYVHSTVSDAASVLSSFANARRVLKGVDIIQPSVFVMDLDLPSYKKCCSGLCPVCYGYITAVGILVRRAIAAVLQIDVNEIGFNFSGRRGFHVVAASLGVLSKSSAAVFVDVIMKTLLDGTVFPMYDLRTFEHLCSLCMPYVRLQLGLSDSATVVQALDVFKSVPDTVAFVKHVLRIKDCIDTAVTTSEHNIACPLAKIAECRFGDSVELRVLFATPMTETECFNSSIQLHSTEHQSVEQFISRLERWHSIVSLC